MTKKEYEAVMEWVRAQLETAAGFKPGTMTMTEYNSGKVLGYQWVYRTLNSLSPEEFPRIEEILPTKRWAIASVARESKNWVDQAQAKGKLAAMEDFELFLQAVKEFGI